MAKTTHGETLRILVVSPEQSAQGKVEAALTNWSGNHQVNLCSQPELVSVRARDLLPHTILIDDAFGASMALSLVRQVVVEFPSAATLMLLGEGAIDQAQDAVLAGARGFVMKQRINLDLVRTLQQLLSDRQRFESAPRAATPDSGRIIAFCAPKGGTGRTTLTVNTALILQEMSSQAERNMVLVDADYSAPALDVVLNLHDERNISDVLPRLSQLDPDLLTRLLAHHATGMDLLLAPAPGTLTESISEPQVQQILAHLKRMYRWIVVDTGLPLDETTFSFLDAADQIVMTVLPEMVGLRNTKLMLEQLRDRGYSKEKIWLILNRSTIRGGVGRSDIEKRLQFKVHLAVPDDQPLVSHSVNRGVPLVLSHPRSAVARAVRKIAQQLDADMQQGSKAGAPVTTQAPRRSLFSRFGRRRRATNI